MPPTLADRVLAHLAAHPIAEGARDVPREVTQEGIADTLAVRVAHVSRALKQLIATGHVSAHLAHPRGGTRRARAHALTQGGRTLAATLPPAPAPAAPAAPARGHVARPPAGRAREMTQLLDELDAVKDHGPRVALIEGDSGSGRTRLLRAFADEADRRGARVLLASGAPVGDEQQMGPIAPALAPIGFERRYRARSAGTPRERALAAAAESLVAAAQGGAVLLALDDLHHAGPGAAEFLHGLLKMLPSGTRVLVAVTFRRAEAWQLPNGPLYTALMPLREAPRTRLVDLAPLTRQGVAELLDDAGVHVLGDKKLDEDLVERVWRESGGNAHYALAMGEELADGVDEEDFFPAAVRASAKQHFATLGEGPLSVLQVAAVCGADFPYDLLSRAVDAPEDALVDNVDELIDRLLLEEDPVSDLGLRLRFRHPKVREAVLADLTATRRRFLENRVADAHRATSA